MHHVDLFEDLLARSHERWQQAPNAMAAIAAEGRGALILIRDLEPDAIAARLEERDHDAPKRIRQFGVGAQILAALGITEINLLSNSPPPSVVGLDAYGLSITGVTPIPERKG